jgi:hypothetical protein
MPAAIPSWIVDSFVFDDYNKKVNQVSQFVIENKFLEAIKQLVTYGNREFLRSFRLRTEIIQQGDNGHSNNKETTTTDIASLSLSLVPPFQTIGFLESKWFEIIKELVEYGNKNILGNFKLCLSMEEKREGEEKVKEMTTSILDIKKEEKGRAQVQNPNTHQNNHQNNNNHNNTSWFRPRDKNGRFISASTSTSQL